MELDEHRFGLGETGEYLRRHPGDQEVFDAAMHTLSRAVTPGILAAHDSGRHRVLADIGGGTGALLAAVLRAHPGLRGPPGTDAPVALLDLMVLVGAGGLERTEQERRELFGATGLRWAGATRVGPTSHHRRPGVSRRCPRRRSHGRRG